MNKIIKLIGCGASHHGGHGDGYICGDGGLCDYCFNRLFVFGLTVLIITLLGIIIYLATK